MPRDDVIAVVEVMVVSALGVSIAETPWLHRQSYDYNPLHGRIHGHPHADNRIIFLTEGCRHSVSVLQRYWERPTRIL